MVFIDYCAGIKDYDLRDSIIKYINLNIQEAFIVARDALTDYLPIQDMIGYNNLDLNDEQFSELFNTAFDIVVSSSVRYTVLPKHQYMIYHAIDWWVETHEDDEIPTTPLNDDLAKRIGVYISDADELSHFINTITDMTRYSELVFEDWDFLSPYLDDMVQLYINNEPLFHIAFPDVDLKDYVPVMPRDIKELYLDYVSESQSEASQESPLKKQFDLVQAILRIVEMLQSDKTTKDYSENQFNTRVRNALQLTEYTVRDQTLTGESSSGKETGEADIQVFWDGVPSCIVEGLVLEGLNKPYLSEHIDRIYKYDTRGNLANVVLSYVKVKDFNRFWENYQSYVKTYPYKNMKSIAYNELRLSNGTETKCAVSEMERSGNSTFLFHIAVHIHI